jgi:uncharacterized protein (TIGR02246 family)
LSPDEIHQSFVEAFNRHDVDAVCALYEPDALLMSAHRAICGAVAIREAYERFLAGKPVMELQTLGVFQAGDLALLFGKWTLRETTPDGSVVQREGYNTETVRRQPDGHWLFAIDQPYTPR